MNLGAEGSEDEILKINFNMKVKMEQSTYKMKKWVQYFHSESTIQMPSESNRIKVI